MINKHTCLCLVVVVLSKALLGMLVFTATCGLRHSIRSMFRVLGTLGSMVRVGASSAAIGTAVFPFAWFVNNLVFNKKGIDMKEITIQIPDNCELVKEGDVYKIKELSYPKTWEEYCDMYPDVKDEYYVNGNSILIKVSRQYRHPMSDRSLLSSKEEAEAFLALIQLRRLREAWVKAYIFDWKKYNYPTIERDMYGNLRVSFISHPNGLFFSTWEMAEEFLFCFKDLLETAKILL